MLAYALVSVVVMLFILDWFYTFYYKHPINARDKVSWLISGNFKKEEKLDYVLFGSSRCIYHLDPVKIEDKTGLKGINLGYSAASPFEIKLMVLEFIENYQTDKIYIQIGDRYNQVQPDTLAMVSWLPYINDDFVNKEFNKWSKDPLLNYYSYVPFYRYLKNESKLGIRNLALSFIKKSEFENRRGFKGIISKGISESKESYYKLEDVKNPHLEEIIIECRQKGIELYFFTAPFYRFKEVGGNRVLRDLLPNYHDYSDLYDDPSLFNDKNHLNSIGAAKFTNQFINDYMIVN